jgi:hypothetical protein
LTVWAQREISLPLLKNRPAVPNASAIVSMNATSESFDSKNTIECPSEGAQRLKNPL